MLRRLQVTSTIIRRTNIHLTLINQIFQMGKLFVLTVLISILGVATWMAIPMLFPKPPPQLDLNEWWGPQELKGKQDTSIKPFQVKFSEEVRYGL